MLKSSMQRLVLISGVKKNNQHSQIILESWGKIARTELKASWDIRQIIKRACFNIHYGFRFTKPRNLKFR